MKIKEAVVAMIALGLAAVLVGVVSAEVMNPLVVQESTIKNLHMSDSCDGPAKVLFPADTETVYVVFDYFNMHEQPYRIAVDNEDHSIELYNATHSYTGSGTECITVTYLYGSIPPGTYRTQIWDGTFAIKTWLWHIRPGGPGEITNPRMSLSSDGPPQAKFKEGTRTVWAIFDYENLPGNEVKVEIYSRMEDGNKSFVKGSSPVTLSGSGTTSISVTHSLITGYPAGAYSAHILIDGYVDAIADWYVLHGVYLPLVVKNHQ